MDITRDIRNRRTKVLLRQIIGKRHTISSFAEILNLKQTFEKCRSHNYVSSLISLLKYQYDKARLGQVRL